MGFQGVAAKLSHIFLRPSNDGDLFFNEMFVYSKDISPSSGYSKHWEFR